MIRYIKSFLNESDIDYLKSLIYESELKFHTDKVYKFYYLDIINKDLNINNFNDFSFKKFRIQMVNETINQVQEYHGHVNPWSFIVFLNEDFVGGEVVFENKIFKPKKGDMIYFSGEELHKVNNCIGNRYTLVGFMENNPLNIKPKNII